MELTEVIGSIDSCIWNDKGSVCGTEKMYQGATTSIVVLGLDTNIKSAWTSPTVALPAVHTWVFSPLLLWFGFSSLWFRFFSLEHPVGWAWVVCLPTNSQGGTKIFTLSTFCSTQSFSRLRKGYDRAVCCHPVCWIYTLSISWEMPGWMSYKLEWS